MHYTSADAAISIIRNKQVWLRKSTTMNDFMEVEHGLDCLAQAYREPGGMRLRQILDEISPGTTSELEKSFNSWVPDFRDQTYLMCLSEHDDSEDRLGRLSMWRAYGASVGVALVLKSTPFVTVSDALNVYTSPVRYADLSKIAEELDSLAERVRLNQEFLKEIPQSRLVECLFTAFRFAILCTKHPGFAEEREWRIIHNPTHNPNERVERSVEVIRGVPQLVMKVKLQNYEKEGLVGAEIPELLDRIIIGPTRYSDALRDAFQHELALAGVEDAHEKVIVSDIPLR